jgi:hypothetical protein
MPLAENVRERRDAEHDVVLLEPHGRRPELPRGADPPVREDRPLRARGRARREELRGRLVVGDDGALEEESGALGLLRRAIGEDLREVHRRRERSQLTITRAAAGPPPAISTAVTSSFRTPRRTRA